eukprot:2326109-Rhodomonas_salina.2
MGKVKVYNVNRTSRAGSLATAHAKHPTQVPDTTTGTTDRDCAHKKHGKRSGPDKKCLYYTQAICSDEEKNLQLHPTGTVGRQRLHCCVLQHTRHTTRAIQRGGGR